MRAQVYIVWVPTEFLNCCVDWRPQVKIINGYIGFVSLRSGRDTFPAQGGKPFVYCPWCGRNRKGFEEMIETGLVEAKRKGLV